MDVEAVLQEPDQRPQQPSGQDAHQQLHPQKTPRHPVPHPFQAEMQQHHQRVEPHQPAENQMRRADERIALGGRICHALKTSLPQHNKKHHHAGNQFRQFKGLVAVFLLGQVSHAHAL